MALIQCSECTATADRHGPAETCSPRCARARKTRRERESRAAVVRDRAQAWLCFGIPAEAAIQIARAGVTAPR